MNWTIRVKWLALALLLLLCIVMAELDKYAYAPGALGFSIALAFMLGRWSTS